MAVRFDLDPAVQRALLEMFERWDGKGAPAGIAREAIALPARIASVAYVAVMFDYAGGPGAASATMRRWSGRALDPAIAATFLADAASLLAEATPEDALLAVVDAEPGVARLVSERRLDDVCRGFADAVDLKSPFFHGHSAGVAALAATAAEASGLPADQVASVRRAGLLHDLGRVGVSTAVWEKPGALSVAEWEQVRLHPYHTERILTRSAVLAPVARLAGFHHERLDGSGYHRGAPAGAIDRSARILAAADVYQALIEPRPHRPAFGPDDAARTIRDQPGLDREAIEAVLETAGHRRQAVRRTYPARLTEREVEVLRLLVRGRSEKQIARELFIAPSTVHTHVLHVYGKTGVSTRAGVALFAMEHDLIHP
jgi:HD-GYP domain-containing protein (c-di-GMP phosphodiesterase class II)